VFISRCKQFFFSFLKKAACQPAAYLANLPKMWSTTTSAMNDPATNMTPIGPILIPGVSSDTNSSELAAPPPPEGAPRATGPPRVGARLKIHSGIHGIYCHHRQHHCHRCHTSSSVSLKSQSLADHSAPAHSHSIALPSSRRRSHHQLQCTHTHKIVNFETRERGAKRAKR
jgi:hypothetical protein